MQTIVQGTFEELPSNCGKRNSRSRRGGFASERGANGRADSLYASLVACASRLLACGVARRPFGNGFCGSAPNSARSAGRSVDLIFSPAPCGCRAFFVSARGVVFWILMRALRFSGAFLKANAKSENLEKFLHIGVKPPPPPPPLKIKTLNSKVLTANGRTCLEF